MYKNDRTRKEILVDFGFRLPSALDNRPLTFEEFEATVNQVVYMSATPGPYELEQSAADRRAADPAHRDRRPADHGPPDRGPDRRPPRARSASGSSAASGRIVTTLTKKMAEDLADYLQRAGRQGPVPPQRGGHARAGPDPARPAPGRVRRAGRDQPAARGHRPAGGHAGGDPRRRQGGIPAQRLVADPDDRPGGPQHRRRGRDVRRPDHRIDAGRDRRDGPPARGPGALQHRARDRARSRSSRRSTTSTTACASAAESSGAYEAGGRGHELAGARRRQVEELVARLEAEMRNAAQEPGVRAGGHAPRRDPGDPAARAGRGRVDQRRAGGRASGHGGRGRRGPAAGGAGRVDPVAQGRVAVPAARRPPRSVPSSRSRRSASSRRARSPATGARPEEGDRVGLAAGPPRRARRRRRRRLAGPLARSAHLGPHGHAQRPPPDRAARAAPVPRFGNIERLCRYRSKPGTLRAQCPLISWSSAAPASTT